MTQHAMNVNKSAQHKESVIDLNDLLRKIVYHWPLYLIILVVAAAGALLYLRYARPLYLSSARLYLKDDKKGGEEMDVLKSLSLFNSGKNIENEMELLRSPILLEQVIREHQFNIRYFANSTFRDKEMYQDKPLTLKCLTDSNRVGNYQFEITPHDQRLDVVIKDKEDHITGQLDVASGQPFRVSKDQFSINYHPLETSLPGPYRIRVDSIQELAYKKIEDISTSLVNKDATVLLVTYQDPVASRTADFLNALLNTYNAYTLDDKNRGIFKTIHFLTDRIDSLREELAMLEQQEEQFKVKRGLTDIDESARLVLEQVKDADLKLNEANMQLSVYNQVDHYVNNPSSGYPFAPLTGNVDQTMTSLINRYEELQKEKKRLSLSLQPGSFILQNLDNQIGDARNTIRNYISGYRRNAGVAQARMQEKVNSIQHRIANIPSYARQYVNIKRQQGVKEALYLFLLKKKEEAAVSYASNVIDNKVIAPAFIPRKPVTPRKTLVFISFAAVGLILSTAYVYIKYFLNNRVLNRKEIEKLTGLSVVADIYQQEEESKTDVSLRSRSVMLEQIFNLRTNLKFLLRENTAPYTILITSSMSGEGKTFISAHLGNALTVNNKKVLLLELDLRKPKLSHFFGIDNRHGISNYLVEDIPIDSIIKKVPGTEGLHIIPSGPIPPNPIELMEGNRMKGLIYALKERFDYIIIDIAPIGLVADAKSLAPYIDCTLFVVRYDFTPAPKLSAVAENIKDGMLRNIGVVFNGIEQNAASSYYYYDHYSYTQDKLRKNRWSVLIKKVKQRIA